MAGQKQRTLWERVGFYSGLGFVVPMCVLVGYGIGYLLDRWLRTTPVLAIIFLLLGFGAGFLELYKMLTKYERDGNRSGE